MDKNQALLDLNKAAKRQRDQFIEVFSTPNGAAVLKALREEFYDTDIPPGEGMEFKLGQRDVVYQILVKLELI